MAHFAEIDDDNIVQRVVVISNEDLLDASGNESEEIGIAVCKNIFGQDTRWKQTSYNNNFRRKYAGIGDKYEVSADLFYSPEPPFPSWTLDAGFDWQPPVSMPSDGQQYMWDEETLTWIVVILGEGE